MTPTKSKKRPAEKQKAPVEDNLLRFTFRPPVAGISARPANVEQLNHTSGSRVSSVAATVSTITKGIKESKAIKVDFRQSLAKHTLVQTGLAQENNEHALRAGVIMKNVIEMRRGLIEIHAEGCMSQER